MNETRANRQKDLEILIAMTTNVLKRPTIQQMPFMEVLYILISSILNCSNLLAVFFRTVAFFCLV
jgi:hypothetical protein